MPLDGLADVAEYTSKAIIQLIKGKTKRHELLLWE